MTTDNEYTTSLAHRSVARAALHLGIEGMETVALETLGGVLMDYMERIGSTISNNVELSGRSSAHVNIYDVIHAIEECTYPAADPSASIVTSSNGAQSNNNGAASSLDSGGWEGLASFLFGPDWHLIPLEGEDPLEVTPKLHQSQNNSSNVTSAVSSSTNVATAKKPGGKSMSALISSANAPNNVTVASSASGKQFPSLAAAASHGNNGKEKNVSFSFDRQGSIGGGGGVVDTNNASHISSTPGSRRWYAPYLGNVEPYPIVPPSHKKTIANPHRLGTSESLHNLATEMEACRDSGTRPTLKRKSSDTTADSGKKKATSKSNNSSHSHLAWAAEEMAMRQALRMPESVCRRKMHYWGCVDANAAGSGDAKVVAPKVKFDTSTTSSKVLPVQEKTLDQIASDSSDRKPSYVPKFMPPFPPTQESMEQDRQLSLSSSKIMSQMLSGMGAREKRKHMVHLPKKESSAAKLEYNDVRQSVIELGKTASYWGSGWQENKTSGEVASILSVGVRSGLSVNAGVVSGSEVLKEQEVSPKKSNADLQVVPLGRASGSRVAKMLEGSMN